MGSIARGKKWASKIEKKRGRGSFFGTQCDAFVGGPGGETQEPLKAMIAREKMPMGASFPFSSKLEGV